MCRNEYIILLTDGAPNLDLDQPSGSATAPRCRHRAAPGTCPFPLPQHDRPADRSTPTASRRSTQASVQTYVIGFAVSSLRRRHHARELLAVRDQRRLREPVQLHRPTPRSRGASSRYRPLLRPSVHRAQRRHQLAYFADTPGDLQKRPRLDPRGHREEHDDAHDARLLAGHHERPGDHERHADAATSRSSSRRSTRRRGSPGRATSSGSATCAPTRARATRSRRRSSRPPQGDDFAAEPELGHRAAARTFIAFQPAADPINGVVGLDDDDPSLRRRRRAATASGSSRPRCTPGAASAVDTQITPPGDGHPDVSRPAPTRRPSTARRSGSPAATCATMLLDYTFAQPTFNGMPSDFTLRLARGQRVREHLPRDAAVVVGPPGSLLQDPGYVGFASSYVAGMGGPARRSSTPRPTTASPRLLGGRDDSSRTTSCGRCCCRA